jgi:O-antigen ligase
VACRWKVPTPLRAIRAGAALAMTGAIFVLSQRANLVALAIGATAAAVHGPIRSLGWIARIALACGAVVAVQATILAVPRVGETIRVVAADFQGGAGPLKLAHDATGGRSSLALVAADIFRERPVIGFGARSYGQEASRRILADPARYGLMADEATGYAKLKTAHNGLLDEAAMRGAVGACLFLALLAVLLRAAWSDRTSITIAVLLAWIAFSMANGTTERGTFLAILAVIVVRCASVDAALRRR